MRIRFSVFLSLYCQKVNKDPDEQSHSHPLNPHSDHLHHHYYKHNHVVYFCGLGHMYLTRVTIHPICSRCSNFSICTLEHLHKLLFPHIVSRRMFCDRSYKLCSCALLQFHTAFYFPTKTSTETSSILYVSFYHSLRV